MIRLYRVAPPGSPVRVWLKDREVAEAWTCDALERHQQRLTIEPRGRVVVPLASRLTSVRLALDFAD
jgi:hypothetical protein